MLSRRLTFALLVLALLPATDSFAQYRTKRDTALAAAKGGERVIVTYRAGASERLRSRYKWKEQESREHTSINAMSVKVSGKELDALDTDPDVAGISLDAEVY